MSEDRRSEKRVSLTLQANWDALSGMYEARLDDISLGGCFVNTIGQVEVNDAVSLEIKLPSGEWLSLRGEVISSQPGIGFGLHFTSLTDEEMSALRVLIA